MAWNLNADRPIYAQLIEHVQQQIVAGVYKPGERIPAVRELAAEASVNPNTMQKALAELERMGLLYSQRTSGRFVTEDEAMIQHIKENLAAVQIQQFIQAMGQLGFDINESISLLKETQRN